MWNTSNRWKTRASADHVYQMFHVWHHGICGLLQISSLAPHHRGLVPPAQELILGTKSRVRYVNEIIIKHSVSSSSQETCFFLQEQDLCKRNSFRKEYKGKFEIVDFFSRRNNKGSVGLLLKALLNQNSYKGLSPYPWTSFGYEVRHGHN